VHKVAEKSVRIARKSGKNLCQWERRLGNVRGRAEAWAEGDLVFRVWVEQTIATDRRRLGELDSALLLLSIFL
jgi:hypothetical protein